MIRQYHKSCHTKNTSHGSFIYSDKILYFIGVTLFRFSVILRKDLCERFVNLNVRKLSLFS